MCTLHLPLFGDSPHLHMPLCVPLDQSADPVDLHGFVRPVTNSMSSVSKLKLAPELTTLFLHLSLTFMLPDTNSKG